MRKRSVESKLKPVGKRAKLQRGNQEHVIDIETSEDELTMESIRETHQARGSNQLSAPSTPVQTRQNALDIETYLEAILTKMECWEGDFNHLVNRMDTLDTKVSLILDKGNELDMKENGELTLSAIGNLANSSDLYLSSIETYLRDLAMASKSESLSLKHEHQSLFEAIRDLRLLVNNKHENLTSMMENNRRVQEELNQLIFHQLDQQATSRHNHDHSIEHDSDVIHTLKTQSEFQSRMLVDVEHDVRMLLTFRDSDRAVASKAAQQVDYIRRMVDGPPGEPGFSETSETSDLPELMDISISKDEYGVDKGIHPMELRSRHAIVSNTINDSANPHDDNLPLSESSFQSSDSLDESYDPDDHDSFSATSEDSEQDEEETWENQEVTLETAKEDTSYTLPPSRYNLFPATPNISSAFWTAPIQNPGPNTSWPTPQFTGVGPTPNMSQNPMVPIPNAGAGTLRVSVPPKIEMVYSATWEKLEQLRKQIEIAERMQFHVHFAGYLDPSVIKAIERSVLAYYHENGKILQHKTYIWMEWTNAMFFSIVNGRFHVSVEAKTTKQDFLDEVRKVIFHYHEFDSAKEHKYIDQIETALRKTNFMTNLADELSDTFTIQQRRELFKDLLKSVKEEGKGPQGPRTMLVEKMNSKIQGMNLVWLLSEFLEELITTTESCRKIFTELKPYLALSAKSNYKAIKDTNGSDDETKPKKTNHIKGREEKGTKSKVTKSSHGDRIGPSATKKVHIDDNRTKDDQPFCETCGLNHYNARTGSEEGQCRFVSHPDANLKGKWKMSQTGKKYLELRPARPSLDKRHKLNPSKTELIEMTFTSPDRISNPKSPKKDSDKKGTILSLCTTCTDDLPLDDVLIQSSVSFRDKEGIIATTLLDPGARSQGNLNLVDRLTVKLLVAKGAVTYTKKATLCDMHVCETYNTAIELSTKLLFDPANNDIVNLGTLEFYVVDKLPSSQILIGWPTLKEHKIFCRCHGSLPDRIKAPLMGTVQSIHQLHYNPRPSRQIKSKLPSTLFGQGYVCSLQLEEHNVVNHSAKHMSQLLDYEVEATGEIEKIDLLDEALQLSDGGTTTLQLPQIIHGPEQLQKRIKKLLNEFRDCFRTTVSTKPAKIKPFSFKIDESKWTTTRSNNSRYRTHSAVKNEEIDRQVQLLLDLKVIRKSTAERYSQVHLVPKPGNKWRFCLDYRFLNSCTTMEGGVIPMIYELLQRIGRKRPKYFAVIDFTSGYHQAPIAADTIPYTAFVTHRGVYEWIRLPMGLKGAPSYFQREVASILGGLIGIICELYLDDLIIFGETEHEFMESLRNILERLRTHDITCNPEKCKFGVNSVEYVGHVIDSEGLNFSDKKKEQVLDFPLPTLIKELHSFLGLVNYFGEHLRDLTTALASLRKLLADSKIKKKVEWTEPLRQDFQSVKDMVNTLPKLYFINDTDPVIRTLPTMVLVHTFVKWYDQKTQVSRKDQ
jgi:hypothetical protein